MSHQQPQRRARPRPAPIDLDVVEVERQERRARENAAAWPSREHTSSSGKREAVELTVMVTVECGFSQLTYGFGDEVVTADEATVVDIEGLLPAMGIDRSCKNPFY